jgi:hypothetical protein
VAPVSKCSLAQRRRPLRLRGCGFERELVVVQCLTRRTICPEQLVTLERRTSCSPVRSTISSIIVEPPRIESDDSFTLRTRLFPSMAQSPEDTIGWPAPPSRHKPGVIFIVKVLSLPKTYSRACPSISVHVPIGAAEVVAVRPFLHAGIAATSITKTRLRQRVANVMLGT